MHEQVSNMTGAGAFADDDDDYDDDDVDDDDHERWSLAVAFSSSKLFGVYKHWSIGFPTSSRGGCRRE